MHRRWRNERRSILSSRVLIMKTLLIINYSLWLGFALYVLRRGLIHKHRCKAIELDLNAYIQGPSHKRQMLDFRKWTFKQFYPDARINARGEA